MKRKKLLQTAALLLLLCMFANGCAPAVQAETSASAAETTQAVTEPAAAPETVPETAAPETAAPAESAADNESQPGSDTDLTFIPGYRFPSLLGLSGEERTQAAMAKNAYVQDTYAPTRHTLASGVEVQPIPDDDYAWNIAILNAEERGCNACHNLMDVVQLLPLSHPELMMPFSVDTTIGDCFFCHRAKRNLGDALHGLHLNSENFDGSCLSCHHLNVYTGEYEMWDYVKYDVLYGINDVADVSGDFTWNQTYITDNEDIFWYWGGGDDRGIQPNYIQPADDPNQSIFQNWTFEISGEVEHPGTYSLAELAAESSITQTLTIMCTVNQPGGSLVANVEATGIPLSYIAEKAGMKDTANSIMACGDDGWDRAASYLYYTEDYTGMLVYKVNGEYLPAELGYPCQIWLPGNGAGMWVKRIDELKFNALESDPSFTAGDGAIYKDTNNLVNAGFFNRSHGEFFTYGEAITFEGYAFAYHDPIVAIEFSLDRGNTWSRYETADSSYENWIYWNYTVTPETVGSYVLRVRAITESGAVNMYPGELMFNVE